MSAPGGSDRRAELRADAIVAIATVAVFARSLGGGFLRAWDDDRFILESETARHIDFDSFVSIWTEPHVQAWHPLHLLSYWIDVPFAGDNATVLHATSIVLWVFALFAVRRAFRALGLGEVAAILATLAFGLHPTQVEVATWLSGRKDILAAGFSALALTHYVKSDRITDAHAWWSRGFFVLAALSKTTSLALPAFLVAVDVILFERPWKKTLTRVGPLAVIAGGLALIVVTIWTNEDMIRRNAAGGSVGGIAMLVCDTITHHLRMAFVPVGNAALYPIHHRNDFSASAIVGPIVLMASAVAAWGFGARRAMLVPIGFLALLLPVSNVVPMYWHYVDRYLSLPLFALAYGFGLLGDLALADIRRSGDRVARLAMLAIPVAILAFLTFRHQAVYASDERLWRHTVGAQPQAFFGWIKLGEWRRDHGDLNGAIRAYRRAVVIEPQTRLARGALFVALAMRDEQRLGLPPRANDYARAFIASMDDAPALRTLANTLGVAGYEDATLMILGRALDLVPIADEALEQAAIYRDQRGERRIALFFLKRMNRTPMRPSLTPLYEEARRTHFD